MTKEYAIIAGFLMIALIAGFVAAEDVVLGVGDVVAIEDTTITEITTTAVPETTTTAVDTTTLAEDNPEDVENGTASGLQVLGQQIKIAFTLNQDKKAIEELKLAKLRLIQARIAAKNGNEKAMTKALEAHDRIMAKVQKRVQKMDEAKDENGIRNSAEKLTGLARAIEVHQQRIEIVKQRLAEENLTAEQKARMEEKLAKIENNTQKLTELQTQKREQIKTKLMAISNKTEQEAEDMLANKEKAKEKNAELKEKIQDAKAKIQEDRSKLREQKNQKEVEAKNETN